MYSYENSPKGALKNCVIQTLLMDIHSHGDKWQVDPGLEPEEKGLIHPLVSLLNYFCFAWLSSIIQKCIKLITSLSAMNSSFICRNLHILVSSLGLSVFSGLGSLEVQIQDQISFTPFICAGRLTCVFSTVQYSVEQWI